VNAKRWLALGGVVTLVAIVVLVVAARRAGPYLHGEIEQVLADRLESEVTLEALDVTLFPRPSITGRGLVIRHRGRTDIPPLVSVGTFTGHASWSGAWARRLADVSLDGLEITIPPRRGADMPSLDGTGGTASPGGGRNFAIDSLTATNTRLSIMPRNPEKDPRVFDIFTLKMRDLTFVSPSTFVASLTNPVPVGTIETEGSFGPWNREEPGDTPVDGRFTFAADLGTIKGIAGALDASGEYSGLLDRIVATGTTRTPDFSIPKLKAAALPLETMFHAVVDGTNGDVQLEQVDARLAESNFVAKGSIVGTKGVKGKRVLLDVTSTDARMDDILRLTVRSQPPAMTGVVSLTTSFDLPQGDRDVTDKLRLAGTVSIAGARFSSDTVQDKVDDLSRRARGRPQDVSIDDVASDITARFSMDDGAITLRDVAYRVPGAAISMQGVYRLDSGSLDFAGTARLSASVADTQTGVKHFLLKPFNPLFRKRGAGTRLAIKVSGTVDQPKFGLDIGRTLKGK
jgi:hypothetical protein